MLYGDCDAVVGSPYGPFAAALGHLVRHTEPEVLREHLGAGGGELDAAHAGARDARRRPARACGDRPRCGAPPPPHRRDRAARRHRRGGPLLLVLEDVHWADASTLQLMRHLVRSGADGRMLLVATFRDADADMPAELAEVLVDVYAPRESCGIRLGGLSARRDRRVRPAGRPAWSATDELTSVSRRPHRGQRVPGHRALARADRLGRRRDRRVRRAPRSGRRPSSGSRRRCGTSSSQRLTRLAAETSGRPRAGGRDGSRLRARHACGARRSWRRRR